MRGRARRTQRVMAAAVALVVGSALLASCDLLPDAPGISVTTTVDGTDAAPGDGVCEVTAGLGDCSLRAAVDEANHSDEIVIITVPSATYPLTLVGVDDDNAAGDLDLDPTAGPLLIESGASGFAIDASAVEGGIDVHGGSAIVFGVGVRGATGDGVRIRAGAIGAFTFASFHGNAGAGVRVDDGGVAQLWVATVSGNGAGGIANQGVANGRFLTVAANTGGGITGRGDDDLQHGVTLDSSIVTQQVSGSDCADKVLSAVATTSASGFCGDLSTATGNIREHRPVLEPLSGGLVPYHRLTWPGPAGAARDSIPVGFASCVPGSPTMVDQRRVARPQGGACDRGAWEGPISSTYIVDTPVDEPDLDPGDGVCRTATGSCALRAAVDEANANLSVDTIQIADGIDPVLSRAGADEDANSTGDLDVGNELIIVGEGNVIDAGGLDRVIDHRGQRLLRVQGVELAGADASATARDGGAVWSNSPLELVDVRIEGARAAQTGAVLHPGGTILTMSDVTIVGAEGSAAAVQADEVRFTRVVVEGTVGGAGLLVNRGTIDESTVADNDGGGIRSQPVGYPIPRLTVNRTTVSGNRAESAGGGLWVGPGNEVILNRTTISGNAAAAGAAIWTEPSSKLNVEESTIVDNVGASSLAGQGYRTMMKSATAPGAGVLCAAPLESFGTNVTTDASCGLTDADDLVVADLGLGPLADNGGPTQTHLPTPRSPLLDRIVAVQDTSSSASARCGPGRFDQRGEPVPQGIACDIGSTEAPVVSLGTIEVTTPDDGVDDVPGDGICHSTAGGGCTLRAAVDESNRSTSIETIVIASGIDPVLSIAGRGEDANATGDIDIAAPVMLAGTGSIVSGGGIDRVLDARSVLGPLVILGLTVADGDAGPGPDGGPGGLAAAGYLRLGSVTFRDNTGSGAGAVEVVVADAGLANDDPAGRTELKQVVAEDNDGGPAIRVVGGSLDITDTELTDNDGGGLGYAGRFLWIRRTTIRGNQADVGAGIATTGQVNRLEDSWIDGNRATGDGGGIYAGSGFSLTRTTVSNNEAGGVGGGIAGPGATGSRGVLKSSTVSGNRATSGSAISYGQDVSIEASTVVRNRGGASVDATAGTGSAVVMSVIQAGTGSACARPLPSYTYNIFGDSSCGGGPTDRIGVPLYLGPLQDNGGATPTHLPIAGSPLVDSVPPTATIPNSILGAVRVCNWFGGLDQRGLTRPQGPACDVGATER